MGLNTLPSFLGAVSVTTKRLVWDSLSFLFRENGVGWDKVGGWKQI